MVYTCLMYSLHTPHLLYTVYTLIPWSEWSICTILQCAFISCNLGSVDAGPVDAGSAAAAEPEEVGVREIGDCASCKEVFFVEWPWVSGPPQNRCRSSPMSSGDLPPTSTVDCKRCRDLRWILVRTSNAGRGRGQRGHPGLFRGG